MKRRRGGALPPAPPLKVHTGKSRRRAIDPPWPKWRRPSTAQVKRGRLFLKP